MKKIILSLFSVAAIATTSNAQLSFAPEAGLNMANMNMKSAGSTVSTSMKPGVAIGAIVDFGFTDNLFLQPGLFYVMNGAKLSSPSLTYSINSLQIPVNVIYKLGEDGNNRFFFGAGPYLAYNLSGNVSDGGGTIHIGTDKAKDQLKPIDFGVGLNVGYLLVNGLFFRVHYQMGLTDLNPAGDSDGTVKTSALGVTAGYYLGHKKAKKPGKK